MMSPSIERLRQKIGQMMVVGFPGGEAGFDQLDRVLKSTAAGNIILFSRNFSSAEEAHAVIAEVNRRVLAATGALPLVCVDQEGGIVARIRQGVTPLPGAMAMGSAFRAGAISLHDVREVGAVCGRELAAIGVNWNLAPVVDVNVNPANPVIGVRSFGEEPELVADMASAYLSGLSSAGVIGTAVAAGTFMAIFGFASVAAAGAARDGPARESGAGAFQAADRGEGAGDYDCSRAFPRGGA